jgi:phosphoribosylformylglycinamidine synthase (EC 6.3.5.3)
VRAVGAELCPALGIAIPVGKDSLSMRATWRDAAGTHTQTAPLTLIVTAFAPVVDVRRTVTPQLHPEAGGRLLLVDLGAGRNRLGGSALGQVYRRLGGAVPDVDDPALLKRAFETLQHLLADGRLLACHDRSDGGLFATLCEMAYAGRCGFEVVLDELGAEPLAALFNEELGWVLQVAPEQLAPALDALRAAGLAVHDLGRPTVDQQAQLRPSRRALRRGDASGVPALVEPDQCADRGAARRPGLRGRSARRSGR